MNIKSIGTRFYCFAAIPFAVSLVWQHAALAHTAATRHAPDLDPVTAQVQPTTTVAAIPGGMPITSCASQPAAGTIACESRRLSSALRASALFAGPLHDSYSLFETTTMLGPDAFAEALDSVAIGHGAHALHRNALALGAGSVTAAEDTVSVGSEQQTRRIMHVTPGLADSDAATLGQLAPLSQQMAEQQQRFEALSRGNEGIVRLVPSRTEGDGIVEIADQLPGRLVDLGGTLGPRRLSGVADGVSQNDAVNMRQYTMLRATTVSMNADIAQNMMDIAAANSTMDERRKVLDTHERSISAHTAAIEAHHRRLDGLTDGAVVTAANIARAAERLDVSEAGMREQAAGLSSLNEGLSGLLRRSPDAMGAPQFSLAPALGGTQFSLFGVNGARRLSGVAAATDDFDAVNLGQLKAAGLFNASTLPADATSQDMAVIYDAPTPNGAALQRVTLGGLGQRASPVTLSNLAAGVAAHDGVNVAQLQPVVAALGAGAVLGPDGAVQAPSFSFGGQPYDNLGAALGAVDTAVSGHARALDQNAALISANAQSLGEHATLLDQHTAVIADHASSLAEHASALADHASNIAGNRADIETHAATITQHAAQIESNFHALDDNIEKVNQTAAAVEAHAAAMAQQAGGLQAQQARIDEQALKMESHQAALERQTADLQSHQDTLDNYGSDLRAHQAALADHTSVLQEHQASLNSHEDGLRAQKAAIDAHHLNLQTHQARIGALESGDTGLVRRVRSAAATDASPSLESLAIAADLGGQQVQFAGTDGSRRLSGVQDATDGTDAVNLRQLRAASLAGADSATAALNDALAHALSYDDATHTALTLGTPAAPVRLGNLANGTNAADAVNVRQLHDVVDVLGGGAALGADGRLAAPVYTLSGVGYGNLADAFGALDANLTHAAETLQAHAADISSTGARLDDARADFDMRLNDLSAAMTDARADGHHAMARAVRYDTPDRTEITLGGIDAMGAGGAAVRLHNLANGMAAGDAVNFQQWQQANASLAAGLASTERRVDRVWKDLSDTRQTVAALMDALPSQPVSPTAPQQAAASGTGGNAGGNAGSNTSGNTSGNTSSNTSGNTSGSTNGNASNNSSSNTGSGAGSTAASNASSNTGHGAGAASHGGAAILPIVTYDDAQRDHLTLGGGGAPATLAGVADGVTANEAVNRAQLDALSTNVTTLDQRVAQIETDAAAPAFFATDFAADASAGGAVPDDAAFAHTAGIPGSDSDATTGRGAAVAPARVDPGTGGMAAGSGATVSGSQGIAHGAGAQALADRSVALGAGSQADRADTVSVGAAGYERQLVNVADATADTDAINFRQMRGLMSAQASATEQAANRYTDQRVDQVDRAVHDLDRSTRRGIAAAAALQNTAPYLPGHTALNAGVAGYRGEAALAVTVSSWNAQGTINWNLGMSSAGRDSTIVRAGVGFLIN
ncbi:MAG: YadA-like family protein [Janthinobacterium lividum]